MPSFWLAYAQIEPAYIQQVASTTACHGTGLWDLSPGGVLAGLHDRMGLLTVASLLGFSLFTTEVPTVVKEAIPVSVVGIFCFGYAGEHLPPVEARYSRNHVPGMVVCLGARVISKRWVREKSSAGWAGLGTDIS